MERIPKRLFTATPEGIENGEDLGCYDWMIYSWVIGMSRNINTAHQREEWREVTEEGSVSKRVVMTMKKKKKKNLPAR